MLRIDAFSLKATRILLKEWPDVAHLWAYSSIRLAPLMKRLRGFRYLYHVSVYWDSGLGHWWFPELRAADRVMALNSDAAAKVTADHTVLQRNVARVSFPINPRSAVQHTQVT